MINLRKFSNLVWFCYFDIYMEICIFFLSKVYSNIHDIFMLFEKQMPFKMHKIVFFPKKKIIKKYVCLPHLKFSDPLPETLIVLFGLHENRLSTEQLLLVVKVEVC